MRRAFICSVFLLAGIFSLRAAETAPEGGNGNNPILTPEEQAWLASHPHIRLGYDPSWPPFSYRGANGEIHGIDADVLALIAQRLGVHFELVTANTWSEVYAKALAREVDVLGGTASTPERQPFFRFSSTYLSFPVAIITRTDAPFLWSAQDLVGHKVAAPRDYAPTLDLQREYPGFQLQLTDTVEEAMKLVSRGQAEAVVTNLANASFIIKTRGLTNLKIAGMMPRTSTCGLPSGRTGRSSSAFSTKASPHSRRPTCRRSTTVGSASTTPGWCAGTWCGSSSPGSRPLARSPSS